MTISLLNILQRKFFGRALANGETLNGADLDAMYADLCEANNRNVLLLRQIANVNGGIQALIGSITSFTASASQTAFSVPAYNTATDKALAFTNSGSGNMLLLASSSVTLTSATVVTLPAQSAGATVMIVILTTGAGTTALASTSTGQGASLVGIEDAGGLLVSTQVEAALQEIAANLASAAYLGGILTISQYVPKSGATMTGDLAFGGTHKVTGLAAATGAGEAVRWEQIQAAALLSSLNPTLNAVYLQLSGGTMTGGIAFSSGAGITGLPQATASGQPLTFDQLPTLNSFRNAIINGGAILANGSDYVASVSGTYGYGKSELCKGALTGTAVAGTLTQNTSSLLGRTAYSITWSAVTTTGVGVATWRFFIEAKDALRFKNQTATASAQFRHNVGSPVSVQINVYKATAADNFAGVTSISSGAPISVASDTNTAIYNRAVSMSDCSNGVLVEVSAAIGAVTARNFELTEVQFELGSIETTFEHELISVTTARAQRYFFRWTPGQSGSVIGHGHSVGTTLAQIMLCFPVEMRSTGNINGSAAAAEFTLFETIGSPITVTTAPNVFGASDGKRGSVFNVSASSAALTQWRPCWLSGTSNAYILFDARF